MSIKSKRDVYKRQTDALFTQVSVLNVGHSNLNVYYDQEGDYGPYNYRPQDTAQSSSLKWNYEMPELSLIHISHPLHHRLLYIFFRSLRAGTGCI